jgi:hypothetical protein
MNQAFHVGCFLLLSLVVLAGRKQDLAEIKLP